MREQLIQYVELLFAAAPNSEEIKQEILQNTLDRYDDLVQQGKTPEAAYRLAISGIGDINEILGSTPQSAASQPSGSAAREAIQEEAEDIRKRNIRAVAVAIYILCPVPLFILSEFGLDTMGLCFTLALVATATYLMILTRKNVPESSAEAAYAAKPASPRQELRKSIGSLIWAIGLAVYFILSFVTNAWYITWVVFPIIASVQGLINACMDLTEVNKYEN